MGHVLKREAAKRDLVAQWLWYAEHADIDVADRFLRAAEETLDLLAAQPESGVPVPIKAPELEGVRRFPVSGGFDRMLLFYIPLGDGIDLIRAIHASRDLEQVLSDES